MLQNMFIYPVFSLKIHLQKIASFKSVDGFIHICMQELFTEPTPNGLYINDPHLQMGQKYPCLDT